MSYEIGRLIRVVCVSTVFIILPSNYSKATTGVSHIVTSKSEELIFGKKNKASMVSTNNEPSADPPATKELEDAFRAAITNELAKVPLNSYLGEALQKVRCGFDRPPLIEFKYFWDMKSYIERGETLDEIAFKKELQQAHEALQEISIIVNEFPLPFSNTGATSVRKNQHARSLLMLVEQALIPLEIDERNFPDRKVEFEYLLSRSLSLEGEYLDGPYFAYLDQHSRQYMQELLDAFDSATITQRKRRVFRLLGDYELNPKLEGILLDRLDLKSSDTYLNIHIVAKLSWAGGDKTKKLMGEIMENGPAYLQPQASDCLTRIEKRMKVD